MIHLGRTFVALGIAGTLTLTLAGFSTSVAGGVVPGSGRLTVELTKFCGPYYCPPGHYRVGTVTVAYRRDGSTATIGHCRRGICHFRSPSMVRLNLVQKPVNPTKWPFKEWKLTTGGKTTMHYGGRLSFIMKNNEATVSAVYKLKESQSAPNLG